MASIVSCATHAGAVQLAPVFRHIECAAPDAALFAACLVLLAHIDEAVARIGDGPAQAHHFGIQYQIPHLAARNEAAIAIGFESGAFDRAMGDEVAQRAGRLLAALPGASLLVTAALVIFGRIDAIEPDLVLATSEGITVDDIDSARRHRPLVEDAAGEKDEHGRRGKDGNVEQAAPQRTLRARGSRAPAP